jgi:hypothetical protein
MTYSAGGLIQATDYNGFASTSAANVNGIWGSGATSFGYGQSTTLANVAVGGTVTATQWSSLNSRITSLANHQGTAITSRSSPTVGDTISILSALNTDITNCTTNRGNAYASGTQYTTFSGTSSQTAATGSGNAAWTLTFTHTITFADAASARYFFNAGGLIKWETSKTSTGTDADDEWNNLASSVVGDLYISGGFVTQNIAGFGYSGTTKTGGTGVPTTLASSTGWYQLTTTPAVIYKQFSSTYGYTDRFIQVTAAINAGATVLTLVTTWVSPVDALFPNNTISGGTATNSPFTAFGTGPATIVTYFPPETTYLTNSWGVPTVAASLGVS